jgi:ArsR family transcriptional regulator
MDLVKIYGCLCDRTRLRLLNLLLHGPLCVCHFQEVLREPQVKISKHLSYLKRHGMVEAERCANWMIYRLPKKPDARLQANLACLQDCVREERIFREDTARLKEIHSSFDSNTPACVRGPSIPCQPERVKSSRMGSKR